MEQLPGATSQSAASPRGSVALGVPPTTGEVLIQHLIPAYRSAYPEVFVRIDQGYVNDLFDRLMDKRIDIIAFPRNSRGKNSQVAEKSRVG